MLKLRRFWFEFEPDSKLPNFLRRYVVTAWTYEDALHLLQERVFRDAPLPPIHGSTEDVDISTLDAGHVRPNMGVVIWRGVWYPLGYESPHLTRRAQEAEP